MPNSITGFKEFQAKLKNLPTYIKREADGFVEDAALQWEQLAKQAAPVDTNNLRGKISVLPKTKDMRRDVVSPVEYSAYMEWGTGTRVNVPVGLQEYALQFKGKKSVIGVYPHPYFFIQQPLVSKSLIEDLKQLLKRSI